MKKNSIDGKAAPISPYDRLLERTRAASQRWAGVNSALQAALVKTESRGQVLDPFAVLQVVADIRADVALVAQVGEGPIAEAETWARQEAQAATLAFDGELRRLCAEEPISVEGRFPAYVLGGFLSLRLSADDSVCTIGSRKVSTLAVGRIWPEITSAIKEEKLRKHAPEDFLASCFSAYKRAVALQNARIGATIPIKDFFRELVITLQPDKLWRSPQRLYFSEYTEEYFKRDLARLIAAGHFSTREGAKLELSPTAFPKDGMAVVIGDGIRIIGHVSFGMPSQ